MAGFNFTALAARDLRDIGRYTSRRGGITIVRLLHPRQDVAQVHKP